MQEVVLKLDDVFHISWGFNLFNETVSQLFKDTNLVNVNDDLRHLPKNYFVDYEMYILSSITVRILILGLQNVLLQESVVNAQNER